MLDRAAPIALALTVFAFACGSSSVPRLLTIGSKARWVMLFVVLGIGAWGFLRARLRLPLTAIAAPAWFVALALISAVWSADPRLTVERWFTLAVLFTAGALLVTAFRPERLLSGLLGGAVLVAFAGLVVLAVNHDEAVQAGSPGIPSRFRGIGESANTASLLFGVALPLALWFVLCAPSARARWLAVGAFALLAGSIVASDSRGALVGGFAGVAATAFAAAQSWRRRAAMIGTLAAIFVVGFYVGTLPKPPSKSPPVAVAPPATHPKPGYVDANAVFPLTDDIGRSLPTGSETFVGRQQFGSSGRTAAWRGALHQAEQRPTVGYGFGTEDHVFVNRYHAFAGGVPEDSYIGLLLQLGAVGLASFLMIVGWWLVRAAGALGRLQGQAHITLAGAAGVVVAGLVSALVQSYVVSVGDIATVTFWISGFVVASLAWRRSPVPDEKGSLGTEGNS